MRVECKDLEKKKARKPSEEGGNAHARALSLRGCQNREKKAHVVFSSRGCVGSVRTKRPTSARNGDP